MLHLPFTEVEQTAALQLLRIGLHEDVADVGDLTCRALIGAAEQAEVHVVARESGVIAGLPIGGMIFRELSKRVAWVEDVADGAQVEPDQVIARVVGPMAPILTGERTALNFLTHLSGIATLTRQFVDEVAGTNAVILDTRKTLPGWRILAKYAVRAGGGTNHRMGLYDGVLIKDNHIASWSAQIGNSVLSESVRQARESAPGVSVEIEVDTLGQLRDVLEGHPDIVLLDNMSVDQLRQATEIRDEIASQVLLEASGGVTLESVRSIAETGVDRISIGALTHSAPNFDIAFDFYRVT
jgi:nicotinate-nucleotide pyrophosphorylase (carboxylating)